MTAPPNIVATQPNRMNPAGISMFYGAFNLSKAVEETIDLSDTLNTTYSIAGFRTITSLNVIDLTSIPPIPDPFDALKRDRYYDLKFLHEFNADITAPLVRDNNRSVDYIPTQVLTEYFRFPFSCKGRNRRRINGLMYRSSKDGLIACVIFADNYDSSSIFSYEGNIVNNESIFTI